MITPAACRRGAAITSYRVTSSPGGFTATGATSPIVVTGLTNGTAYTFTVTATNSAGTSTASATVAFTAPVSNGGSVITAYTATSNPGSVTGTVSQAGGGTITVSGLTAGTPYTFTVTATNSAGTSAASGASGSVTPSAYPLGSTGPGGGLVFLISGGTTYEMAPKTWSGTGSPDAAATWCDAIPNGVAGAVGAAVGTGAANTAAMAASVACSSDAAAAVLAYAPAGTTAGQWYLPSKDEVNAMCYYSRNLSASPDPTVSCFGVSGTSQNGTFAGGTFGFPSANYWSSSQYNADDAWNQYLGNGGQDSVYKDATLRVRPVRSF